MLLQDSQSQELTFEENIYQYKLTNSKVTIMDDLFITSEDTKD